MTRLRLRRPSPAMVVALFALFVAMGGASYAAFKVPKNSVGSKQIKANAVTGGKVKNGSLTGADVNESTLGRVPLADNATNAAALGGSPASAYVKSPIGRVPLADNATNAAALGGSPASTYVKSPIAPSQFGTIPAVRATNTSNELIHSKAGTTLTFDTNEYDNDGMHSTTTNNSRLTAPISGIYEITGNVAWGFHDPTAGERDLYIVKNGQTAVAQTGIAPSPGTARTVEQVTTQVDLNAGDYVELDAYQGSDDDLTVFVLSDYSPVFAMHWLGP
jgi:hypothetical protein